MTNNKQQTAVEWLWEIAYNRELTVEDWKQAKEMYQDEIEAAIIKQCAEESTSEAHKKDIHRQQIIAAYKKGWEECNNLKYLPATYYETTYNTK